MAARKIVRTWGRGGCRLCESQGFSLSGWSGEDTKPFKCSFPVNMEEVEKEGILSACQESSCRRQESLCGQGKRLFCPNDPYLVLINEDLKKKKV